MMEISSSEQKRDNVSDDRSKTARGKRAGKKVKDFKNQKKNVKLLMNKLALQCSSNYPKKIITTKNKSCEKLNEPNDDSSIDKSKSCAAPAKGRSRRGKRAGRQVAVNYECTKLATLLSALAQECANN